MHFNHGKKAGVSLGFLGRPDMHGIRTFSDLTKSTRTEVRGGISTALYLPRERGIAFSIYGEEQIYIYTLLIMMACVACLVSGSFTAGYAYICYVPNQKLSKFVFF
jgi:hypothetical protein